MEEVDGGFEPFVAGIGVGVVITLTMIFVVPLFFHHNAEDFGISLCGKFQAPHLEVNTEDVSGAIQRFNETGWTNIRASAGYPDSWDVEADCALSVARQA